jgi:hypothetical protein
MTKPMAYLKMVSLLVLLGLIFQKIGNVQTVA